MNTRMAELKDLEALVEIYNQSIAAGQKTADLTPFTTVDRMEWFEGHSPDKYPILVTEKEKKIVGYLTISEYRSGRNALRHTAEVSFFIHFGYHRQGIASSLLNHAIEICPTLKIKTLFAILLDGNQGSVNLLKKFGFEKWGHMPHVAEFDGVEVGHLYYGLRINKGV